MYLDGQHIDAASGQGGLYDGIATSSVVSLCPSFTGQVAHYIGFGQALTTNEVQSLYATFDESGIIQGILGFDDEESDGGLSGGAVVAIVIGSFLAVPYCSPWLWPSSSTGVGSSQEASSDTRTAMSFCRMMMQ
jgi:hypothetical protein